MLYKLCWFRLYNNVNQLYVQIYPLSLVYVVLTHFICNIVCRNTACVCALSCSVMSDSLGPHGLYSPPDSSVHGDSPGKNTEVGCCVLQGIFPTQGWNPGLPYCKRTLYHLSYQGSLKYSLCNSYLFEVGDVYFFFFIIIRINRASLVAQR